MKKILFSGLYSFAIGAVTVIIFTYVFKISSEILVALLGILASSISCSIQVKRNSFIFEKNIMQSYGQKGGKMTFAEFSDKK